MKAVLTSLNTAFLQLSRSRLKQRKIPLLLSTTVSQFCLNIELIFGCFGKEIFFSERMG